MILSNFIRFISDSKSSLYDPSKNIHKHFNTFLKVVRFIVALIYNEAYYGHGKGIVKVLKSSKVIPIGTRVCIYPKDVQRIMGKEYLHARLYLRKVKKYFNKEPHHEVSIEEFCEYSGLKMEHILRCIL